MARGSVEAWNDGDFEASLDSVAPDFEFVTSGVYPGLDDVYRGHGGMRKFWRDFRGPWNTIRITIEETRDCGDRVIALYRFEATARDGMKVNRQGANVWTFKDGLMTRTEAFGDWNEALEAAGLSE